MHQDERRPIDRRKRHRDHRRGLVDRIAAHEEGYINFVSCFLFMAFIMGLCLVGNVGRWTNEKIRLQNAADSAAYSSALHMARGMNAITASNHMMGELTALNVILESFIGRERARGEVKGEVKDNDAINEHNDAISNAKDEAPYPGELIAPEVYWPYGKALHKADAKYIEAIVELFVESEIGKHKSHGAIYDAQLTLKHNLRLALVYKKAFGYLNRISQTAINVGNIPILAALKVLGWVGEISATGGHLWLDYEIFNMAKEWVFLQALQTVLDNVPLDEFIELNEDLLIPALSFHGDSVAALNSPGPVNRAIVVTQEALKSDLAVETLITFPVPDNLSLPVVPEVLEDEDESSGETGASDSNQGIELWKNGSKNVTDESAHGPLQELNSFFRQILKPFDLIKDQMKYVDDILEWYDKATSWINPVVDFVADFGDFDPDHVQGIMDELTGQFGQLAGVISEINTLRTEISKDGFEDNPSLKELEDNPFDWQPERTSQWTRATYPYVDSFRTPIRKLFRKAAGVSNASTYFANWSNRYTIVDSYYIRRDEEEGSSSTSESESDEKEAESKWTELLAKLDAASKLFGDAAEPEEEEVDALSSGTATTSPFDQVANLIADAAQFAKNYRALLSRVVDIDPWIERADKLQQTAQAARDAAQYQADFDISQEDFMALAYQVALIEEEYELLRMLQRLWERVQYLMDNPFDEPPHMYIMVDSSPGTKGKEPWTNVAPLQAEQLFTLTAYAHVTAPPSRLLPAIFKVPGDRGRIAQAQAMVYNANGRDLEGGDEKKQPNTGWDTLNWQPPVAAPEWGARPTDKGKGRLEGIWPWEYARRFPFDVFTGRKPEESAAVKLNWQAKLAPLTSTRFRNAIESGDLPPVVEQSFENVDEEQFDALTHQ